MIAPERTIPTQESVDPHAIALDPELQSRDATDERIVSEYAEQMRAGAAFPPVVLYYDGDAYWCADGWHRVLAARAAEAADVDAEIRTGTRRDALRHALGANASHGVRRTSADKRRAVMLALADEEWAELSDREIARLCAVSHTFVAGLRRPKPEGGNVAAAPSPVAAAALATPAAPPPLNALALGELVRCARELLDHAHKGAATSEELKASVERRLDTEITLGEWVAALDRGELEGRWSCSSGRVESASPRVRTAPPAPGSPIPRSEREADGGGLDLRTSPVGSAPPASLSSPPLPEDADDPAAQGHQAAIEEGSEGDWIECDRCDGEGHLPNAPMVDCTACNGEGGWYDTTTNAEGAAPAPTLPPKAEKPRPAAMPERLDRSLVDLRCESSSHLLARLEDGEAALVIADPPWSYRQSHGASRADDHYPTMPTEDIAMHLRGAHRVGRRLALWITGALLGEWVSVKTPWGQPVTAGAWVKSREGDEGQYGQGYHWAGCSELVLLYTHDGCHNDRSSALRNAWIEDRGEHSAKPIGWQTQWIRRWVPEGGLVVDLYAGLGSVAHATLLAGGGRRYVGAELDPERHARALEGIEALCAREGA